jgi:adenylylsulfate kinase
MRHLADGVVLAGGIAVADFVCPTEKTRKEFAPDYTVWMDTIKAGRFEDTNAIFEPLDKNTVDFHVEKWFNDTHLQLLEVVSNYITRRQDGN